MTDHRFNEWLADRSRRRRFWDWPFFGWPGINGAIVATTVIAIVTVIAISI